MKGRRQVHWPLNFLEITLAGAEGACNHVGKVPQQWPPSSSGGLVKSETVNSDQNTDT